MTQRDDAGYIIETYRIGNQVKVTAVDTVTGREVSIMGPTTATEQELTRLAVQKLEYVLNKKS